MAMGKSIDAIFEFRKALAIDPNDAKAHNNFGILWKNRGDLAAAEREFVRAIQLDPNYAQAYNHLGTIYLMQNRLEEAQNAFEKAIECADLVNAHYNLTLLYDTRGESEKSIEHWEAILGINE